MKNRLTEYEILSVTTNAAAETTVFCPPRIIRGPYLQQGTDSSIVIRWATDTAVRGQVRYGTECDKFATTLEETITCDHKLELSGLAADRKYYYSIGSSGVQTDDAGYFVTAPSKNQKPEQTRPLRIWVVGDAGRGNEIAGLVRDGYLKFTGDRHTDIWLMLGDNAYDTGTLDEYQRGVFDTYPEVLRRSVLWTAIGNHDAGSANSLWQTGPYYELFTLPTDGEAGGVASGTAAYYSFDYGNIHFICLDSYGSDRSLDGTMCTWMVRDAAASDKDWLVAFWHHPPYTKGSHDSDLELELIEMRRILPLLEDAGVDLVLGGHSHAYERSYLIDGHYGFSDSFSLEMKKDGGSGREDDSGPYKKSYSTPHAGAVYIVAGTSALADRVMLHPAMYTSLSIPGSLVLDVDGKTLDVKFIDEHGEVQDYFTIEKS